MRIEYLRSRGAAGATLSNKEQLDRLMEVLGGSAENPMHTGRACLPPPLPHPTHPAHPQPTPAIAQPHNLLHSPTPAAASSTPSGSASPPFRTSRSSAPPSTAPTRPWWVHAGVRVGVGWMGVLRLCLCGCRRVRPSADGRPDRGPCAAHSRRRQQGANPRLTPDPVSSAPASPYRSVALALRCSASVLYRSAFSAALFRPLQRPSHNPAPVALLLLLLPYALPSAATPASGATADPSP